MNEYWCVCSRVGERERETENAALHEMFLMVILGEAMVMVIVITTVISVMVTDITMGGVWFACEW